MSSPSTLATAAAPSTPGATADEVVPLATALRSGASADKVVFYRSGWEGDVAPQAFMIDGDGSHEVTLEEQDFVPGAWSPDHTRIAITHVTEFPGSGLGAAWARPVVVQEDGTGGRVLNAEAGGFNLVPLAWSPDGKRIFVYSGFDATSRADMGTFSIRASDGGDRMSLLRAPDDALERPDFVHVSPDGRQLLINRQEKGTDPDLRIFDIATRKWQQLNPRNTTSCEFPIPGLIEGGGIAEAWSPDGSKIAMCTFANTDNGSALYVSDRDGTGLKQIVSPSVGAVSAQWSPDGSQIAFTSRWRSHPQVWTINADGSDMQELTDGADGSTSVGPLWSPDGTRLLFERSSTRGATLWTMQADGSNEQQLTSTPLGPDLIGPYAWWAASAP